MHGCIPIAMYFLCMRPTLESASDKKNVNALIRVIDSEMKVRGWNQTDLAAASKVNQGTISRIMRGESNDIRNSTLDKIAAAFKMSPGRLRQLAERPSKEPVDINALQDRLTDSQRQALVAFLAAMLDG